MKVTHPKSIKEAINNLEVFFEVDMWYAKGAEWKTEGDMLKYLRGHFNILKKDIKRLSSKTSNTEVKKK